MKFAVYAVTHCTNATLSKVVVRSVKAEYPYICSAPGDIEVDAAAARALGATIIKAADQIDPPARPLPHDGPRKPVDERRASDWLKNIDNRQLLLDAIRLQHVHGSRNMTVASFDDAAMAIALTVFAAWWAGITPENCGESCPHYRRSDHSCDGRCPAPGNDPSDEGVVAV
jgi:hypothetical protein